MNQVMALTCIKFTPLGSSLANTVGHSNYIYIFSDVGCWSYVGMVGWGQQRISLQNPAWNPIIVHELMHAIGMEHEQSRTDRDNYVIMQWANIQYGTGNRNMMKINTRDNNPVPTQRKYFSESVLQYKLNVRSSEAFAINPLLPSMTVVDSRLSFLADTATGLMFYDTKDVCATYQCTQNCPNATTTCQNGGFMNTGATVSCYCYCPSDLYGSTCEQVTTSPECGGIIEIGAGEERTITSPGWPNIYTLGKRCVWVIKGPAANHIKMTIDSMAMNYNSLQCYHWLEVRYNLAGQTGPKLCGIRASESYVTTTEELKNQLILKADTLTTDRAALAGFTLRVQSVELGCVNTGCVFGTCRTSDGVCICTSPYSGTRCDTVADNSNLTATFETGAGLAFMQNEGNAYDWSMITGPTPTDSTGPSGAAEGTTYMYLESSAPHAQGDIATLTSAAVTFTQTLSRCLRFSYSMYGANMGSLNVYYQSGTGSRTQVWSRSGDQGNQWNTADVDIPSVSNVRISFDGVRGSGHLSDIGLDDIQLYTVSCMTCDFEPGDTSCFLENLSRPASQIASILDTQFDWTQGQTGSTPSSETGPSGASSGQGYAFIEASYPRVEGDQAVLRTSNTFLGTIPHCLTFDYHMFGSTYGMGELIVYSSNNNSDVTTLFKREGDQGDQWIPATVEVPTAGGLVVRCQTNPCLNGGACVENVSGVTCQCASGYGGTFCDVITGPLFCSFNTGTLCSFLSQALDDGDDWLFGTYTIDGIFAYTEASFRYWYTTYKLTTSGTKLQESPWCLTFNYNMYGGGIGWLQILTKSSGVPMLVWSRYGNQGINWFSAGVTLASSPDLVKLENGVDVLADAALSRKLWSTSEAPGMKRSTSFSQVIDTMVLSIEVWL
uniref:Metalloendopeptidase n=1 Tax=Magallana gigas TaxID=29159 RepID=K1RKB5_MAGGI